MFLLVIGLDIAELALEYMSRGSINNNNHRSTLLRPHAYYPISLTSTHKKIGDFTKEQLTIVHYCMYIKAQLHKDAFIWQSRSRRSRLSLWHRVWNPRCGLNMPKERKYALRYNHIDLYYSILSYTTPQLPVLYITTPLKGVYKKFPRMQFRPPH